MVEHKPIFSIIIPTINRYTDLTNTLKDLFKQNFQCFEILIIDQTDIIQRQDIIENDKVRYFYLQEPSASAARNFGILQSSGEILLFLDDDVIIRDTDFLGHYNRAYEDSPNVPGIVGCVLDKGQEVRLTRHWLSYKERYGWLFFPQNYGNKCYIDVGRSCNLSVKKSVAIEVGGMDENFIKGAHREEADFCLRVVKKFGPFMFLPEACLLHIGNPDGGIRQWNTSKLIKAQHHYDGAMYFMMKNVRFNELLPNMFATYLYFLGKKEILKRPHLILKSIFRLIKGFINARKSLKKGPRYLN